MSLKFITEKLNNTKPKKKRPKLDKLTIPRNSVNLINGNDSNQSAISVTVGFIQI